MKTAIIAGATGLIGAQLVDLLVQSNDYEKVVVVSRKPAPFSHSKIQNIVIDLDDLQDCSSSLKGEDVFSCLGSTIRQAGSKDAFRKVDYEYPVKLARITKQEGAQRYLIVTAMGADKKSMIFYNKVKGEVEEAVKNVGFETLHILQPSFLEGHRPVQRAGEGTSLKVMKFFDFVIPRKYKAIKSDKVARAMIQYARATPKGIFIHDSGELQDF